MKRYSTLFYGQVTLHDTSLEDYLDELDQDAWVSVITSEGDLVTVRKRNLELLPEPVNALKGASLNALAEEIRLNNVAKGFCPAPGESTNIDRNLMLIVGELAEAQEELRSGHTFDEIYEKDGKLEGFAVELADSIIRTFGFMAELGLDIDCVVREKMNFNSTRPHLHTKAF